MTLTRTMKRNHPLPANTFQKENSSDSEKDKNKLLHATKQDKPITFKKLMRTINTRLLPNPFQHTKTPLQNAQNDPVNQCPQNQETLKEVFSESESNKECITSNIMSITVSGTAKPPTKGKYLIVKESIYLAEQRRSYASIGKTL